MGPPSLSFADQTAGVTVAVSYQYLPVTMQTLPRTLQAHCWLPVSRLPWATASRAGYSTQFEEAMHHPNPSTTQKVESPPITPDSSTGKDDHVSDGRSSQTTSTYIAEEPMRQLVHKVHANVLNVLLLLAAA